MITNMEDRYYIPEDDDLDSLYEEIEEYAEELCGQGGEFEWCEESLFYEALIQCGIDEGEGDSRVTPENCSPEVKQKCKEYAYQIARYKAEQRLA